MLFIDHLDIRNGNDDPTCKKQTILNRYYSITILNTPSRSTQISLITLEFLRLMFPSAFRNHRIFHYRANRFSVLIKTTNRQIESLEQSMALIRPTHISDNSYFHELVTGNDRFSS